MSPVAHVVGAARSPVTYGATCAGAVHPCRPTGFVVGLQGTTTAPRPTVTVTAFEERL